jgi:hypothetical protein
VRVMARCPKRRGGHAGWAAPTESDAKARCANRRDGDALQNRLQSDRPRID